MLKINSNSKVNDMKVDVNRVKTYMKKNFRKELGKLVSMEIKNEMILLEYEWNRHTSDKNFKVYFNTEVDYLRIDWDEEGWRSLKYYKGEW